MQNPQALHRLVKWLDCVCFVSVGLSHLAQCPSHYAWSRLLFLQNASDGEVSVSTSHLFV